MNWHPRRAGLLGIVALAAALGARAGDDEFFTVYPGRLTAHEQAPVTKYLQDNAALAARGPLDIAVLVAGRLPADTPGTGQVIHVTDAWVRYNNRKIDPDNPRGLDAAYARSLGYRDIVAFPTFGAWDDGYMIPYPVVARDKLLVSQLNHSVTSYAPVYPGDTLYLVHDQRTVTDLTPAAGSTYRSLAIRSSGRIYNQRGEKVNDVVFRVTESIRIYKDRAKAPQAGDFGAVWVPPNWASRPAHVYTDADWDRIKSIWAHEQRRSGTLYWDDVQIGDQPTITAEGPFEQSVSPEPPWGQGAGGGRTLRHEIMDPATFKTMVRGDDGVWQMPRAEDNVLPPPEPLKRLLSAPKKDDGAIDTTQIHRKTDQRAILVNYMGRDLALRHIDNWMGDRGWVRNIRWGIMPVEALARVYLNVPRNPDAVDFLAPVPFMRGKTVNTHGMTGDLGIVHSYVYDKYVRDGEPMVELAWWIETIEGDIWLAGGATVKLPLKPQP